MNELLPLTLTWQQMKDPHGVIHGFFRGMHYPECLESLDSWFRAVFENNRSRIKSANPSDVLFFYERIVTLLEAAWLINRQDNRERGANLVMDTIDERVLLQPNLFATPKNEVRAFTFFPRSLEDIELLQPYRVFRQTFKFQKIESWKAKLHDLVHNGISRYRVDIGEFEGNLYLMHLYLHKILDACHLIHIREHDTWSTTQSTRTNHSKDAKTDDTNEDLPSV